MSKSPNYLIPALGVTSLVLGVIYGWTQRDAGADRVALLEDRVEQVKAQASAASDKARAGADRVAALEAEVAEVQALAEERLAAAQAAASAASLSEPAPQTDSRYGIGRAAMAEEIAAWDVDVLPDGRGLPQGSGNAYDGEEVFADKCAACHGDFAEGVDNWPVLAGGFDTLADKDPVKTVGSYLPHLSTVFDYVHRSMPFGEAGTLTADETYSIVAYILYSNDLIDDEFELSQDNLGTFEMYNKDGFIVDDRPTREYEAWRAEPCMQDCKDEVSITMRSVFLVETPEEGGTKSEMNHASVDGLPTFSAEGASHIPVAATSTEEAAATPEPEAQAEPVADETADFLAAGEKVFKKCKACHQVGEGAKNKTGPQLNGVMGRVFGSVDGFKYSKGFKAAMEEGRIWDDAALAEFLAKPKAYIKGTKMSFAGLKKDADIQAITAYLKSFGD